MAPTRIPSDMGLTWLGADGSMWMLHGGEPGHRRGKEGVILTGASGLLETPNELRRRAAARQHGSTPGTRRFDERPVELDVVLLPTPDRTLDEVAEAWLAAWDRPGNLLAGFASDTRGERSRFLRLYAAKEMEPDLERDPHRRNFLRATVHAVAPDPFALEFLRTAVTVTVPESGEATFEVDNPSSFELWPQFTCTAGQWEFPDGISGESVPLADSGGAGFLVDTDPQKPTVTVSGRDDGWRLLLGRDFRHAIPARTGSNRVTVKGPPGGRCEVVLPRRWKTLW